MRGIIVVVIIAVRLATAAAEPAAAPRVLTKAGEIAGISPAADAPPVRVAFEGSVSYQDPTRTIFLADETGVTFVFGGSNPIVQPGDVVRITGSAHHGVIIGGIRPERVAVIGQCPPPPATPVEPADLPTGRYHYHRVTIEGVIHKVAPAGEEKLVLALYAADRPARLEVEAPSSESEATARRLVDARVRATGLVVGNVNDRRQLVDPFIRVKRLADVEVVEPAPADAFDIPVTPLDALVTRTIGDHRVRVRGTAVAGPLAGAIYLRDSDRGLRVVLADKTADDVRAGDVVETVGFPEMGPYSVELSDATLRVTGSGPPPSPRPASGSRLATPNATDGDLVWIEGTVIDVRGEPRLVVRDGTIDYMIEPPADGDIAATPGSLVRATGVCRVAAVEGRNYRAIPTSCRLLLEAPEAFTVIRSPPWWTPGRLLVAAVAGLAALAAVVGLAAAWIMLLRRQVRRQLTVIERTIQAEAIAEERRRIAREFHDSLNQGLAAATIRIDAAAHRITDAPSKTVLDHQRRLLATLQAEAREFLWDLRDPVHADAPLAAALEAQQEFVAAPASTTIAFEAAADASELGADLTPEARHQIVRIVREAVVNAVRHAEASRIAVLLRGTECGGVTIEVSDNGVGFDMAARAAADGHFGIRGMQERARRIGGALSIETTPGRGTRVTLQVGRASQASS